VRARACLCRDPSYHLDLYHQTDGGTCTISPQRKLRERRSSRAGTQHTARRCVAPFHAKRVGVQTIERKTQWLNSSLHYVFGHLWTCEWCSNRFTRSHCGSLVPQKQVKSSERSLTTMISDLVRSHWSMVSERQIFKFNSRETRVPEVRGQIRTTQVIS
jgi:hypothetical protein